MHQTHHSATTKQPPEPKPQKTQPSLRWRLLKKEKRRDRKRNSRKKVKKKRREQKKKKEKSKSPSTSANASPFTGPSININILPPYGKSTFEKQKQDEDEPVWIRFCRIIFRPDTSPDIDNKAYATLYPLVTC
jgi:hypothetical protein